LTLLELVVVMAILAALAAIIVPLFPTLLTRAQASAGATNIGEIVKAVQLYQGLHSVYGDQFDSIIDDTGAVASYVPDATVVQLSAAVLSAADVTALSNVGIQNVAQMVDTTTGDWNPTFFPYGNDVTTPPTMTALSGTPNATVAYLSPAVAARELGVTSAGKYVVFGLGRFCTLSGDVMMEAPVSWNAAPGQDPNLKYSRYGLVFQTQDDAGALTTAKFVGAVAFSTNGIVTRDADLSLYYAQR
jgi:type II secretory pathway pseudopilin PulG